MPATLLSIRGSILGSFDGMHHVLWRDVLNIFDSIEQCFT